MTSRPADAALQAELAREQEQLDRAHARLQVLRDEAVAHEQASLRPTGASPQAVYERDVTALAAAARRADLDGAGEGLLFGRLDRVDAEVLHVGRLGLRTAAQDPIVVDWRAPAAAAFYRATAADPQGVVRRRTITTRLDRVVGVDDELLDPAAADRLQGTSVVGDGAFLAAVSRERGPHMRDIVATIQAEQDEAVRAPDDGALVVTGGPGTGKTAVALHRVAYLMYARREWYGRRGVLVVGPSPVFVDYISAVLPALGETGVRLSDLAGLPVLPRGLATGGWEPAEATAVKGSARMVPLLRRVVRELADRGRAPDLQTSRWGTPLHVPVAELLRRRGAVRRSARSHNGGRAAFAGAVVEVAWRVWERRPAATRLESDDREEFGRWLRGDPAYLRTLDALWPVLLPQQVFEQLRGGRLPLGRLARDLYSPAEVALLAGSGPLTAADAALLDELGELLGAPPEPEPEDEQWSEADDLDERARTAEVTTFADRTTRAARDLSADAGYRTYAHVVVDEAQDVTPMQWRMLGRRARGATWTVVGDWAQSAWPDVQEVRDALTSVLGRARLREATLSTNYRTSTEVATLAARVLHRIDPAATAPLAVRTTGVEPRLITGGLDLLAGEVEQLLASVSGTVGVVCAHASLAAAQEALAGVLAGTDRVAVLDSWQAKGLEFDGCLVLRPAQVVAEGLTREAGLRTLYVALTRATQRLVVLGEQPLADLLG